MNFRHRGPHPVAHVRVVDVSRCGERRFAIGDHLGGRRLVRDEGLDLLRMPRDEGQGVHRAAAAREEVHGSCVQRRNQPVDVVGVLIGRRLG
jgi:hypothetical protein